SRRADGGAGQIGIASGAGHESPQHSSLQWTTDRRPLRDGRTGRCRERRAKIMSTTMQPPAAAPKNVNRLGYTIGDYKGADSTLCAGCGHDAITSQIIKAFYEYGVEPHRVAKLSGIGCSSKTPAYFLSRSHGFNGVHGRMPALGTGVMLAN